MVFIGEGREAKITLTAENSTGEIAEYLWDYTDSWNSEPFQEKESGKAIQKTYSETGKYWFALKVIDIDGREAQDYEYVYINYHEEYKDKIGNDESKNQSFPVNWGAHQIYAQITYPSGGTPPNNLSLALYDDNGDRVDEENRYKEQRSEGENEIEEIKLPLQEVEGHKAGEWNAEVRRNDENYLVQEVEYTLVIEVIYEKEAVRN